MVELFLNAIKLITSEDVRKSANYLLSAITSSPEWQKDICFLEAKVSSAFGEQCVLISDIVAKKMEGLSYPKEKVSAFKNTFEELVANAFEHGCEYKTDSITINLDISETYVALTVLNPRRKFNPFIVLEKNKRELEKNPYQIRGRGLIIIEQNADSFEPFGKNRGVKVVFYKSIAGFSIYSLADKDITIIKISYGHFASNFKKKLISVAKNYLHTNLILDFSNCTESMHWSLRHQIILELNELYEIAGKKIVALLPPEEISDVILPNAIIAYSPKEALSKISLLQSLSPSTIKIVNKIINKRLALE